jgi:hypothetical protein
VNTKATAATATKIMVIRHAEKAQTDADPKQHGININGEKDKESLIPLGWQRAGALVDFFVPRSAFFVNHIATPQFLFAADPGQHDKHSERPEETITPLSLKLNLAINTSFHKKDFASMVSAMKTCAGIVLAAWQHQDIPSIGNAIMGNTSSVPQKWPGARFDIVWVFDLDSNSGQYSFNQVPQELLAGDLTQVIG